MAEGIPVQAPALPLSVGTPWPAEYISTSHALRASGWRATSEQKTLLQQMYDEWVQSAVEDVEDPFDAELPAMYQAVRDENKLNVPGFVIGIVANWHEWEQRMAVYPWLWVCAKCGTVAEHHAWTCKASRGR